MTQWEYLTVRRDDDTKSLDDYGKDGWELVTVYEGWTKYGTKGSYATFKRPISQSVGEILLKNRPDFDKLPYPSKSTGEF